MCAASSSGSDRKAGAALRRRGLRHFTLAVLLVGVLAAGCAQPDRTESVTGDWHGTIEAPGAPVEIGVNFAADGTATLFIPQQGIADVGLGEVNTDHDGISFVVPGLPGDPTFRGSYDRGSGRITGDFTQAGQTFPLVLRRGKVDGSARPQEPKPPFPYTAEEVAYRNGDITIAGTLTEPPGEGPFPAIVMITGSGRQDRNEEIVGHKPFLLLADTLTRAGYAVLRTDDRGVGGTTGVLDTATYSDLAADIAAGVGFLRARPSIDPARIGLFGHSEGGFLAPLVAARPDSGVAFAILMAGPGVPGADVLVEQARTITTSEGASPDQVDTAARQTSELVAALQVGDLAGAKALARQHNESTPPEERVPDDQVDAAITPYFAALAAYDPAPALTGLRIPVLALFGGTDVQVPPAQSAQPMREHLAAGPDATVHVFAGINHLMQPSDTGRPSEYASIETTIAPEVLDYVLDWLRPRFPTT
ncbi:S9 family peptidase [Nocardia sp. CNY236]|uniref:alpha/beta hydrolase family protein n=1 Tax=Nocardia sp. CNY236 TaxID=1169152 RepID=UPI0004282F50|nr:alpha/beta fold hydrolase [Nocardia sp. CNY236]